MKLPLAGQVALITGGAQRVGRAIALGLAHQGMDVVLTFNTSAEQADRTCKAIRGMGRQALAIAVDLSQPGAVDEVHGRLVRRFDRLDVLINNASSFSASPFGTISAADFQQHMAVNALAPLMLIQTFAPMLAVGYDHPGDGAALGRVVNLVDVHVLSRPLKRFAAYNASKAALVQITKTCALELAPQITVNAVAPGVVAWPESSSDHFRNGLLARVPMGRAGCPRDVAGAVLYLVRDAPYCTGQIISVDGGLRLG